LKVLC